MKSTLYESNDPVPDFTFTTTGNKKRTLSDYAGKNIIFYFYPKDHTPVCTIEAKAFRDNIQAFDQLDTVVFGVSRDSVTCHEGFKAKLGLPFELIADTSEELCNYFDVIKMKNFFGKQVRGIVRSTFVIDKDRFIRKAFRKIKVHGHIELLVTTLLEMFEEGEKTTAS